MGLSNALLSILADLVATHWPEQRIFIATAEHNSATYLDQWLWECDENRFFPHRLMTEKGSKQDIIIGWQPPMDNFDILINIQQPAPKFASKGQQVVDFVPADTSQKQHARRRYRDYQAMRFELKTQPFHAKQLKVSSTPIKS